MSQPENEAHGPETHRRPGDDPRHAAPDDPELAFHRSLEGAGTFRVTFRRIQQRSRAAGRGNDGSTY